MPKAGGPRSPNCRVVLMRGATQSGCVRIELATALRHQKNSLGGYSMRFNRRTVLKGALATGVATSTLKVPAAVAQAGPIKVGFLTVKSGALASGGLQMEQGMLTFFKE